MTSSRVLSLRRPMTWACLALLAVLSALAGRAAAKCGGGERSWSLALVSAACDRAGTDCTAEKASVVEAAHWQAIGSLTTAPAGNSVSIRVRDDGRLAGNLSEISP